MPKPDPVEWETLPATKQDLVEIARVEGMRLQNDQEIDRRLARMERTLANLCEHYDRLADLVQQLVDEREEPAPSKRK